MVSEQHRGDATEADKSLGLVVIGHVNHGKTALVRALTGLETDRLKEEIARGMSITLGFAWRDYPAGVIDFVDAPGHEDFIRAMTTGATGARAALLVVSAVEGIRQQTREHLRIAHLLGIAQGIVAVTKSDLLAEGERAEFAERIAAELDGSFLAEAPVVFCSSRTGFGLGGLHAAMQALVERTPTPARLPGAYLPLDLVFNVPGVGAVATGALQGAALAAGEAAVLQPSGRRVVLRQLQVHGRTVERVAPGRRVAVGLRGVSADALPTGEVVCAPDPYQASLLVDVEVMLSSEATKPLKAGDEVRVLWGARQDMAKVRPLGGAIAPGGRELAQLRFRSPTIAYAGQRGVLRRPSPAETIGGVTVLDPVAAPIRGRVDARRAVLQAAARGDLDAIAAHLAQQGGGVASLADAARLSRSPADVVWERLSETFEPIADDRVASRAAIVEATESYLERLAEAHRCAPTRAWAPVSPLRAGLARALSRDLVSHVERRLAATGQVRLLGAGAALPGHDPFAAVSPTALARLSRIEQAYREGGMTPPGLADLPDAAPDDAPLQSLLIDSGRLVSLRNVALRQTLVFHRQALNDAVQALRAAFPPPLEFSTGEARAALVTSRKFIVPVLEHLDGCGATIRTGDLRRVAEAENSFDLA